MEHRGEILPVPVTVSGGKGKAMKKDDQYKMMYAELEKYMAAHCRTEKHTKVLNCLLESRNRPPTNPPGSARDDKGEWDIAVKELDRYNNMTEREKSEFNEVSDQPSKRSPSPGPLATVKKPKTSGGESLLDLWKKNLKENSQTRFTVPFAGMRSVGEKAKLYLSLERKEKEFSAGFNDN